MNGESFILQQNKLDELLRDFPPQIIRKDWIVVYAGHYPNVGILVLEGQVLFANALVPLPVPSFIAIKEILSGVKSPYDISVLKDSVVCIIDRQQVLSRFETPRQMKSTS